MKRRAPAATSPVIDLMCACASARQMARLLTQLYDNRLRATGIEAPQFALMMTLDAHGPSSQAMIARRYGVEKTTLSRNLRLLERNGWIESTSATDRRHRQFALTAEGRERLAAAKPAWKRAQDQLRSAMSAREWEGMFAAFKAVKRATHGLTVSRA